MSRKKKPIGKRRHGHHPHPANECEICAHPSDERQKKLDQLPSLDEIPVLGEEENGD